MLYLKETKEIISLHETLTELPCVDKYFWESRSVYAVEFKENVFINEMGECWNEINFTRVQFEENIISNYKILYCKEHPISGNFSWKAKWAKDLLDVYVNGGYDSRKKEQFDYDFNKAIENIKSYRK